MKKWDRTLNSIMITSVSVTIMRTVVDNIDLKILRPEVYAMRSAPWYVGGLVYGAITSVLVLLCCVIKLILRRRWKKNDRSDKQDPVS